MSEPMLDQLKTIEELAQIELDAKAELVTNPQSVSESVPLGLKSGFWRGVAQFNRFIGLGAFDTTKKIFVDPVEQKAKGYEDQIRVQGNVDRFITGLATGVGGLGATLPADVMSGGMLRAGMVGRMTPAAQEFLTHVPDFAIGMWARGTVKGATSEGSIPKRAYHALADGFEELVNGVVYHKTGSGVLKTPIYFAVGAGQATNDALKEGRLPTWEEIVDRGAQSAAFNAVMTAVGNVTGISQSPAEKAAAKHMEEKLQRGRPIREDIEEILASDKFSPEYKDQVEKLAEVHEELPTRRVIKPPAMETAVANEHGTPLRVFHGTNKEFEQFEWEKIPGGNLFGPGFYFTEDAEIASEYAFKEPIADSMGHVTRWVGGPNIRPAYLEIKNPLDMDAPPEPRLLEWFIKKEANRLADQELQVKLRELSKKSNVDWEKEIDPIEYDRTVAINEELIRYGIAEEKIHIPTNSRLHVLIRDFFGIEDEQIGLYQKLGYDGITHTGGHIMGNKEHRVWIAWNPEQVKPGFDVVEMESLEAAGARPPGEEPPRYKEVKQEFTSADTSINQSKLPAVFGKVQFKEGTENVDIGGGRFDNATEALKAKGVTNHIIDPFNRPEEHNQPISERIEAKGDYDTATISNVLNVIKEPEARNNVILQAARAIRNKPEGVAYFTVYEGNGSGEAKATTKGWQENRKTKDYVGEIENHFSDVRVVKGVIEARKPKSTPEIEPLKPADASTYKHRQEDLAGKYQLNTKQLNDLSEALLAHQRGDINDSTALNIRIGHFTTNEEARDAIYFVHEQLAKVSAEKTGGVKPLEKTAEGASKISFTKEAFTRLRKRVTGLDEAITAARASMIFSAQRLIELKTLMLQRGDEKSREDYMEWLKDHAEIKIEFDAIKKEAGRAVGSFKIDVLAQEIMEATDLAGMKKVLSKFRGPKLMNALLESWKSGLFWGPVTHVINLTGSAASMVGEQIEYGIAAGFGGLRSTNDRIQAREVGARAIGLATGMINAAKYVGGVIAGSAKTVKENASDDGVIEAMKLGEAFMNDASIDPYHNKFNSARYAISQEYLRGEVPENASFADFLWKGLDLFGMITRASFTALGTEDNFMKGAMYESAITGIATREAMRLKLDSQFIDRFVKAHRMHLQRNLKPLSEEQEKYVNEYLGDGRFHKEAMGDARRAIFGQQFEGDSQINNLLRSMERGLNGAPFFQFVVPVFKAVTNILKYVGRRTPLIHKLSSEMTADIESGGRRRDLAYARLAYGTMLYMVGGYLASQGLINGARPKDMRSTDRAAGVQQYSLQTDDGGMVEYGRLDPLASFLGLPANMYFLAEHLKGSGAVEDWEYTQAAGYTILALSSLYLDKSYAKGVKDVLDAVTDDRGVQFTSWVRNFGTSFVPFSGMWSYMASHDSVYREAYDFQTALLKRVNPSAAPVAFDNFGKASPRQPNTAGIFRTSQLSRSPIRKEMVRLEMGLAEPAMYFKPGVRMTDEQHNKMREILGKLGMEEDLNRRITTPYYLYGLRDDPGSNLPGTKGWFIRNVVSAYRAKAKYLLNFTEDDQLIQKTRAALYGVDSKAYNDGETLGWGKFLQRWKTDQ